MFPERRPPEIEASDWRLRSGLSSPPANPLARPDARKLQWPRLRTRFSSFRKPDCRKICAQIPACLQNPIRFLVPIGCD